MTVQMNSRVSFRALKILFRRFKQTHSGCEIILSYWFYIRLVCIRFTSRLLWFIFWFYNLWGMYNLIIRVSWFFPFRLVVLDLIFNWMIICVFLKWKTDYRWFSILLKLRKLNDWLFLVRINSRPHLIN